MREFLLTEENKSIQEMILSSTTMTHGVRIFIFQNENEISHIAPWPDEVFLNPKVYIFKDHLKIANRGLLIHNIPYTMSEEEFFQNSLLKDYFSVKYEWLQEAKEYFDFVNKQVTVGST